MEEEARAANTHVRRLYTLFVTLDSGCLLLGIGEILLEYKGMQSGCTLMGHNVARSRVIGFEPKIC